MQHPLKSRTFRELFIAITLFFAIALAKTVVSASAQTPAGLLAAEKAWNEANLHHDTARLRAILSPAFVQITESGTLIGRESALKALSAEPATGHAYRLSRQKVFVKGDIATVSAIYTEIGVGRHGAYRVTLRLADIYERTTQWKGLVGYAHLISLTHCRKACTL